MSETDALDAMRNAVCSPTGRISVSPAFSIKGTYWGVQVYDGRKKVGPFLIASDEDGQTAAGALRTLARVVDAPTETSA